MTTYLRLEEPMVPLSQGHGGLFADARRLTNPSLDYQDARPN